MTRAARGEARALVEAIANGPDPEECFIWPFARMGNGYPVVADWRVAETPRPIVLVYRLAWELRSGEPFPADVARHRCGAGADGCVNLGHILPGTQSENCQDTIQMGRHNAGERNGQAKLTDAQAEGVRQHARDGVAHRVIAHNYGVSVATVSAIVNGRRRAA